jgi:uncharacterized protein (DUF58 family)
MNGAHMLRPFGIFALAALSFLAAQGTGIRLFFHLFYLLLALLVLSYLWAWSNLRGLQVQRETYTHRTQVGEQARERITIRNTWPLPKLWIELRDYSDMPQHSSGFVTYLPGHDRRRWVARTPCTMRGKYTLGPATLISGDPFGIFRLERQVEGTGEVLVYPQTNPLPSFVLPSAELAGGQDVKSRTYHVTPNVATIRDYQPGDSFNRIHWRSTARTGQLMVKEFELDPTAEVYLVLDMQERIQQQQVPDQPKNTAWWRRPRSPGTCSSRTAASDWFPGASTERSSQPSASHASCSRFWRRCRCCAPTVPSRWPRCWRAKALASGATARW